MLPRLAERIPQGEVLAFAPERVVLERLGQLLSNPVVTTDLHSVDVDAPGEDIQKLTFATGRFALIVCNHVLEHVPDDSAALCECARVLMPGGMAVITIPGRYGPATKVLAEPDGSGHYRHYGLDVIPRMRAEFGDVEVIDLSAQAETGTGVRRRDFAFVCTRTGSPRP